MKDTLIKKLKHPLPLSILAGILNGTSYIPFPPWAVFFCLTPLFYIWITQPPKKVFLYTALTYFIGILIGFFWINHLLMEFAFFPIYISVPILLLFAFFLQIHIAIAGFIWAKYIRPWSSYKTLNAGVFCALVFYLVPSIFPWHYGYTWLYGGLTGYQFADIIGFDGLNIITILVSALVLGCLLSKENKMLKLAFLSSFLLAFNFFGYLYGKSKLKDNKESIEVVIVQANIGNLQKQFQMYGDRFQNEISGSFFRLSKEALIKHPNTDLVIWPETAYPQIYNSRYFYRTIPGRDLENFLTDYGVNLISGFYVERKSGKTSNSALFMNNKGEVVGEPVYKKILLMFGEFIPFEKTFPFLRKILPTAGDFERGNEAGVRLLDNIKFGVQICYESLFPEHTRKLSTKEAQIIVNLTNDSWYGKHSQPKQHLYLTAARAVESRLPLIRSTNTGISTVILANGEILEKSPLHKEGAFHYKVPFSKKPIPTIYTRFGFALALPFMLIVFILSIIIKRENNDRNDQS